MADEIWRTFSNKEYCQIKFVGYFTKIYCLQTIIYSALQATRGKLCKQGKLFLNDFIFHLQKQKKGKRNKSFAFFVVRLGFEPRLFWTKTRRVANYTIGQFIPSTSTFFCKIIFSRAQR